MEPSDVRTKLLATASLLLIVFGVVLFQKKTETVAAIRRARRKKKEFGNVNIGAIFGMDVGGTLTKIVYFEAKRSNGSPTSAAQGEVKKPDAIQRGSSDSLAQLDCPEHQAALENFYAFMDSNKGKAPRGTVVRDEPLEQFSTFLQGKIHFLHFETRNMVSAIKFVNSTAPIENIRSIGCTGGGAHKYASEFEEELEITFNKFDELHSLVRGMHFALNNFESECYTYRAEGLAEGSWCGADSEKAGPGAVIAQQPSHAHFDSHTLSSPEKTTPRDPKSAEEDPAGTGMSIDTEEESEGRELPPLPPKSPSRRDPKEFTKRVELPFNTANDVPAFPYLVVNIGSGVSILKVTGPGRAERVSGTSIGGGTYWGLCRLLTSCESYDEVLDFAERGDASVVDMLVKDIYGGDYAGNKLSGSMVASSFGKLVSKEDPRSGVREEDLALALLMMITNNIGQVAYLVAQLQKCSKIFFMGNFLRQNPISCRRLSYAINFWSGGKMEAMFLVHEGYFGALGTFLMSAFGEDVDKVIAVNNIAKKADSVAAGQDQKGTAVGTGSQKQHGGAAADQDGVLRMTAQEAANLRSLRGRSFSDDYASRTVRDRHSSLSPRTASRHMGTATGAGSAGEGVGIAAPPGSPFFDRAKRSKSIAVTSSR